MSNARGVHGFRDWRFWVVLLLYVAACLCFGEAGVRLFDMHVWFPALLAFWVASTLAWNYRLIGAPTENGRAVPYVLILHAALFVALFLFFNRLIFSVGENITALPLPDAPDVLDNVVVKWAFSSVIGVFTWIMKTLFYSLVSFALFAIFSVILLLKRQWALAALLIAGLVAVMLAFSADRAHGFWTFMGLVAAAMALYLQQVDDRARSFWRRVEKNVVDDAPQPRIRLQLKYKVLNELQQRGKLSRTRIQNMLKRLFNIKADAPGMQELVHATEEDLLLYDDLVEQRRRGNNHYLVLKEKESKGDVFESAARIPILFVTLLFTLLYVISPIDLIPDTIPALGILDDLAIGVIGGLNIANGWRYLRLPGTEEPASE